MQLDSVASLIAVMELELKVIHSIVLGTSFNVINSPSLAQHAKHCMTYLLFLFIKTGNTLFKIHHRNKQGGSVTRHVGFKAWVSNCV